MNASDDKPSIKIAEALDEKIRQASGTGRSFSGTVEATTPAGKVSVGVEDADRLGVLAGPITATRPEGSPVNVPAQAAEAVRRLNYLQEPLAVIESEDRRGRAILRSAAPRATSSGGREYNEAILDGGGSISIRRFRAEAGSRRKAVPSNLSRDTLGRLTDDLVDILEKTK
jgi:hypothetical protein